ncbi:MAG TPA: DUF3305 domain-containing protein, partial [Steroidobacteraceae bacterium]|nr:DUF3305 domain-containing protein [Steroidobacteraceae bacterium]
MTQPKVTMPVAAIMARRWVERGRLRIPSWRAIGVVGGDRIATATARGDLVQTVDDEQHFLWAGFTIELFRDAAQTYWENLTGESPSVFILCHETEPGQLE